jgi:hypothetical protein
MLQLKEKMEVSSMTNDERIKYYEFGNPLDDIRPEQLKFLLKYTNTHLYRFRCDNNQSIENLKKNTMWMSSANNFNDPFECRIEFDLYKAMYYDKGQDFQLSKELKEKIRSDQIEFDLKAEKLRYGTFIACFTERSDSILMWSHYANFHKGFCIEYNFIDLLHEYQAYIKPVLYCKKINTMDLQNPKLYDSYKKIINKAIEWDYEKEYRVVIIDQNDKEKINQRGYIIQTPKPSKVILGCRTNCDVENEIKRYCIKNNVNLSKMIMHYDEFSLIEQYILKNNQ